METADRTSKARAPRDVTRAKLIKQKGTVIAVPFFMADGRGVPIANRFPGIAYKAHRCHQCSPTPCTRGMREVHQPREQREFVTPRHVALERVPRALPSSAWLSWLRPGKTHQAGRTVSSPSEDSISAMRSATSSHSTRSSLSSFSTAASRKRGRPALSSRNIS